MEKLSTSIQKQTIVQCLVIAAIMTFHTDLGLLTFEHNSQSEYNSSSVRWCDNTTGKLSKHPRIPL